MVHVSRDRDPTDLPRHRKDEGKADCDLATDMLDARLWAERRCLGRHEKIEESNVESALFHELTCLAVFTHGDHLVTARLELTLARPPVLQAVVYKQDLHSDTSCCALLATDAMRVTTKLSSTSLTRSDPVFTLVG